MNRCHPSCPVVVYNIRSCCSCVSFSLSLTYVTVALPGPLHFLSLHSEVSSLFHKISSFLSSKSQKGSFLATNLSSHVILPFCSVPLWFFIWIKHQDFLFIYAQISIFCPPPQAERDYKPLFPAITSAGPEAQPTASLNTEWMNEWMHTEEQYCLAKHNIKAKSDVNTRWLPSGSSGEDRKH